MSAMSREGRLLSTRIEETHFMRRIQCVESTRSYSDSATHTQNTQSKPREVMAIPLLNMK